MYQPIKKTYNFDIAIFARVITLWGAINNSPSLLPQYWGKHLLFGFTNIIFADSKQTLIAIDPFFDKKYSRRKYYWGLSKGLFLYCLPFSFALLTLRQQKFSLLTFCFIFYKGFADLLMASFLYCSSYSYRSSTRQL